MATEGRCTRGGGGGMGGGGGGTEGGRTECGGNKGCGSGRLSKDRVRCDILSESTVEKKENPDEESRQEG